MAMLVITHRVYCIYMTMDVYINGSYIYKWFRMMGYNYCIIFPSFLQGWIPFTIVAVAHMFQLIGDAQLRIVLCQAGKVHHLKNGNETLQRRWPKIASRPCKKEHDYGTSLCSNMFNSYINQLWIYYKWQFSIAMLVYQSVVMLCLSVMYVGTLKALDPIPN